MTDIVIYFNWNLRITVILEAAVHRYSSKGTFLFTEHPNFGISLYPISYYIRWMAATY